MHTNLIFGGYITRAVECLVYIHVLYHVRIMREKCSYHALFTEFYTHCSRVQV